MSTHLGSLVALVEDKKFNWVSKITIFLIVDIFSFNTYLSTLWEMFKWTFVMFTELVIVT